MISWLDNSCEVRKQLSNKGNRDFSLRPFKILSDGQGLYHNVDIRTVTSWPASLEEWPEDGRLDGSPMFAISFNESGGERRWLSMISGVFSDGFRFELAVEGLWPPTGSLLSDILICRSCCSSSSSCSLDRLCFCKQSAVTIARRLLNAPTW